MFDETSSDFKIFNEIIELRRGFLGIREWGHPRYAAYDYPQRLCLLSDMNRVYVLREIGDIQKFIDYENEINGMQGKEASPQDSCILDMAKWTDAEIKAMKPIESEKEKIVLSLLIYGKEYIKKCINVTFKSLMTANNLHILCEAKQPIFHMQTDEEGKLTLEEEPIIKKMKEMGIKFEYSIIPDSLMKKINEQSVYWLVGAAATVGIECARTNNAIFHHCYPDIIYSNNFFSELLRLSMQHKSILSPAHRTDEAIILEAIKSYENDECISIPSPDLVAIGLNCLHMCHWPTLVNNRPGMWLYPRHHYLMWESHNHVHFNCPHLNAIWLSAETVQKSPKRFYISLDSELDFICEDENFYLPQQIDDLYLVEFSNQGKQKVDDVFINASNYAEYFWTLSTNRDNFKFFTRGMTLKINRELRSAKNTTMDDNNLMQEKVYLINTVVSKDPGVGTTLTRPRTHLGRIYGITQIVEKPAA